MKKFIYGFFACLVLTLAVKGFSAAPRFFRDYKEPANIALEFENIYNNLQPKSVIAVELSTPTISDIGEGDVFFSTSSGKGFTRIGNDIWGWQMTKI